MKVRKDFLETIINYQHVSSNDMTRIFICGVAFKVIDNYCYLYSTDGYHAIRSKHKITLNDNDNIIENQFHIIDKNDIKLIEKSLKDKNMFKGYDGLYDIKLENDQLLSFNNDNATLKVNLIYRDYPAIEKIYQSHYENNKNVKQDEFIFNPDLIWKLRKAIYGKTSKFLPEASLRFNLKKGYATCKAISKDRDDCIKAEHECIIMGKKL